MNERQKKILITVAVVILAMLLYPPYIEKLGGSYAGRVFSGYEFIFDLPSRAVINVPTLLVQWIGVLIAGAIIFFMFKE